MGDSRFHMRETPIGYLKDPNDRFKIVVDEAVAPIVRRIFSICIEGMGAA